jgi:Fe-S cluster assembly protein SufD
MTANNTSSPVEAFTAPYAGISTVPQGQWVPEFRNAGLAHFSGVGLPTTSDEDWRFTPLSPLGKMPFRPSLTSSAELKELPGALPFGGLDAMRIVFVDGQFIPALSTLCELPAGAVVRPFSSAGSGNGLPEGLGKHVPADRSAFAALNAAYFTDGVEIRLDRGVELARPVHLVFLTSAAEPGTAVHVRTSIHLEENASATVVETYGSLGGAGHFTNVVEEVHAGAGSRLEVVRLQDENPAAVHIATVGGHFDRSSQSWLHSFLLGARLSRVNLATELAGEGLECILNGLYLTRGDQLADHHMVVDHAAPHCASHEYFNGILDDRSRGVFHGRILVRQIAQKTDAKQTNKNILLSDSALVDTKPQLEIYADDVKCTHGATVGQLNDESIFYLRSRGMGLDTAKRMLIHAFAGEIIERVQCDSVREELDQRIWNRLEQNPHIRAEHV